MIRKKHITAVVPAYNEEKTLGNILKALTKSGFIQEIIVINDGSKDNTARIAKKYRVKLVDFKKNHGKSIAIKKACTGLTTDILFFCDADLIRFRPEYADNIIRPVYDGEAGMSIGLRNYNLWNPVQKRLILISGERAILNSYFQKIMESPCFSSAWSMEIVMNEYCRQKGIKVKAEVYDYSASWKPRKMGFLGLLKGAAELIEVYSLFLRLRIYARTGKAF